MWSKQFFDIFIHFRVIQNWKLAYSWTFFSWFLRDNSPVILCSAAEGSKGVNKLLERLWTEAVLDPLLLEWNWPWANLMGDRSGEAEMSRGAYLVKAKQVNKIEFVTRPEPEGWLQTKQWGGSGGQNYCARKKITIDLETVTVCYWRTKRLPHWCQRP